MTKTVIAYVRVSTDTGKQTTENQKIGIDNYLKSKPDWKLTKVFEDNASGSKTERDGLKALLEYCKEKKPDILLVWKLDRLGRSTIHLLQTLNFLEENGIGFCSVTENIDSVSPAGRMVTGLLSVLAQFEKETMIQRINCGLDRARQNNVILGRPRKGMDIGMAMRLRSEGKGYKQIASALSVPRTTVYRYLKGIPKTPDK